MIRAIDSKVTFDLLETLGATPTSGEFDDACEIDGAESGLRQSQSLPFIGTFTGDVTFFPKYQVLAANSAAFERLSDAQRTVIRDAAAAAQRLAIAEHPSDADAALVWCDESGGRVVLAGPDGVAAFVAAAQPVYETLAADPAIADAIEAIQALKGPIGETPGAQACGPESRPDDTVVAATGPTPIDGTYVTSITYEELVAYPELLDPGEVNDGNWGDITISFDAGAFSIEGRNPRGQYTSSGTFEVDGDILVIFDPNACCPVEPFGFRWSLEGDKLTLSRVEGEVAPSTFVVKPWTKVSDQP